MWIFVPWLLLFYSAGPFPLLCTTCQDRNNFRAQSEGNYRHMGTNTRFRVDCRQLFVLLWSVWHRINGSTTKRCSLFSVVPPAASSAPFCVSTGIHRATWWTRLGNWTALELNLQINRIGLQLEKFIRSLSLRSWWLLMPIPQRWRNQVMALGFLAAGQVPAGFSCVRCRCHGSSGCRWRMEAVVPDSSGRWKHSQTGAAPAAQSPGNGERGAGRSSRWLLLWREGD